MTKLDRAVPLALTKLAPQGIVNMLIYAKMLINLQLQTGVKVFWNNGGYFFSRLKHDLDLLYTSYWQFFWIFSNILDSVHAHARLDSNEIET
ncbi:unnamed protein product [Acanthoscelides obtectus]|uniref:Uncharacterized protein n=1 Tax=Acanthoscelides obtectus TaxID=200917 RepID=A0A9P0KQH4_ACAOB|nr:unnamed protein product [Acanthoscelides obtectus]CAK1631396.1 hypothetical protein AOBTE_LOCUS6929 [Acanthoscelides obtectus]